MKLKLSFAVLIIALLTFFTSCEKEMSIENGGVPPVVEDTGGIGGTAQYTLSGGTGSCSGASLNGPYTAGTTLTASNTVTLQVSVDSIGTYSLSSSSLNGMSFSGSGSFTATGSQTITLIATGTPTAPGTFNYSFGSNGCSFSVTVTDISNTPAVFTLGGAPGACTGFSLGGVLTAGTAASAANNVTFNVIVTSPGTYTLSTTPVNGISYAGSGTFTTAGPRTVTLAASGTPAAAGNFDYSITQGAGSCTFVAAVTAPAAFTLTGTPGSCTTATVSGTYQNGTALGAANTVTVSVDVSSAGGYSLTTNAVNGMTFSTSGTFTTTGPQTVVLTGTGTPTAAGTFTFNPQVGGAGCTFDIIVTAAPIPSGTFSCKIDGVLFNFPDRAQADVFDELLSAPYLYLDGFVGPPNGESVNEMQIFIEKNDGGSVGPGSYNENSFLALDGYRIEIDFHEVQPDQSVIIWNTSSTLLPPANPAFTINVTEVTATRVKGTFSGQLKHTLNVNDPTIRTVTEGVFDLPIQ